MIRFDAGDIFGRRVMSHFTITKLVEMLDSPILMKGYVRDTVLAAIHMEHEHNVKQIWEEIEA